MTKVIGARVDTTSYSAATDRILDWARRAESRYVCVANVHVLMEARDAADLRQVVNAADLVTPDGMPLVWMLRAKGFKSQERVYGPTLMLHVVEAAWRERLPLGFYGATPEVLDSLVKRLAADNPGLKPAYSFSPPFGELSTGEDEEISEQIRSSGARILFVGLGCPKQERWMAGHRGRIPAVMIGVGAAFDFLAGMKPQAPSWMQKIGLEWLFRLIQEPRRLWRRYLIHNPRFAAFALAELMGWRRP